MSTVAEFVDGANFEESIKSVRNDDTDDKYVVAGHCDNNPTRLEVIKVGQDVSELGELMDETQVMYALARYESTFDMSTTVKFVYFRWIGDKVPFVKKGKYGVVHGSVQKHFNPYHKFIETSTKDEFVPDNILQQLEETTGKKSKVLETTVGRQERGFTQNQLPKRGPTANFGSGGVSSEGAKVEISPEVHEAIEGVRSDLDATTWTLAEYRDTNPNGPIDIVARGVGGIEELMSNLSEDKAMYGLYRVTDNVDDITTVKFVYIVWVGPNVKPMTKAKISTHKGLMEKTFGSAHVAFYATDPSDLNERIIMEKVTSASGTKSHVK